MFAVCSLLLILSSVSGRHYLQNPIQNLADTWIETNVAANKIENREAITDTITRHQTEIKESENGNLTCSDVTTKNSIETTPRTDSIIHQSTPSAKYPHRLDFQNKSSRNLTEKVPKTLCEQPVSNRQGKINGPLILTEYLNCDEAGNLEEARKASEVNSTIFLGFESYSGFLNVDKHFKSNTFFWYFPVEGKVEEAPCVIWLQGGPGASSLSGLFQEFGPFFLDNTGVLSKNPYTWLQNHSLVFIDNPVSVGFSHTGKKAGVVKNMATYSTQLYEATRQLLLLFPELQRAPLYIAGESYAGKYVPSLALELHKHKDEIQVNLQGIMLGNAHLDQSVPASAEPWLHFGLLNVKEALAIQPTIDAYHTDIRNGKHEDAFQKYSIIGNFVLSCSGASYYNYLLDEDITTSNAITIMKNFLEQPHVRAALHVGKTKFIPFNRRVYQVLGPDPSSVRPKIEVLLEHYRVLTYCGNLDSSLPCVTSAEHHRTLNWSGLGEFISAARQTYYFNDTVAGYFKSGGNFTEAVIFGAGHMVPVDKPALAQDLITKWTHSENQNNLKLDSKNKSDININVTNDFNVQDSSNNTESISTTSEVTQITKKGTEYFNNENEIIDDEKKPKLLENVSRNNSTDDINKTENAFLPTTKYITSTSDADQKATENKYLTTVSNTETEINNEIINEVKDLRQLEKSISINATKVTTKTDTPSKANIKNTETINETTKPTKRTEVPNTETEFNNEIIDEVKEPTQFETKNSINTIDVTTKSDSSFSSTTESNSASSEANRKSTETIKETTQPTKRIEVPNTEAKINNEIIEDVEEPTQFETKNSINTIDVTTKTDYAVPENTESVSTTSEANRKATEIVNQTTELPKRAEMPSNEMKNEIIEEVIDPKQLEKGISNSSTDVAKKTENATHNTKSEANQNATKTVNETTELPKRTEVEIDNEIKEEVKEPKWLLHSNSDNGPTKFSSHTQTSQNKSLNGKEARNESVFSESEMVKIQIGNSTKVDNEIEPLTPVEKTVYRKIISDNETSEIPHHNEINEMINSLPEDKPLILTPYLKAGLLEEARNASEVNSTLFLGYKSYSGFFTVNETYNSNTFFWYFPAEEKPLDEIPCIIWLQGGPGVSSIMGLLLEIGPLSVDIHGRFKQNPNSWQQNHSLIFIDNPIGTGFSFTDHKDGYAKDMETYSKHLYSATQQLLTLFPELQRAPLYVVGESYAGKYVPSLALELHNHKDEIQVNLQGIMVGNGYVDPVLLANFSRTSYYLGLLSPEDRRGVREDEAAFDRALAENRSADGKDNWFTVLSKITNYTRLQQMYNFLHSTSLAEVIVMCNNTMQRMDVRKALHVGHVTYNVVNFNVISQLKPEMFSSAKAKYEYLLEHYKVLLYCGQLDQMMGCGVASEFHRTFKWNGHDEFDKAEKMHFKFNGTVAGYHQTGGNLTEALIRGAGHVVPGDRGGAIRSFVTRWIRRQPFCAADEVDPEYCIRVHRDVELVV